MFLKPLIIAGLILLVAGLFMAGCSKHRFSNKSPEEKAQWITEKISAELDLDDSQNVRLQQIKDDILAQYKNHGDLRSDIWQELDNQLKNERLNEQSLNDVFAVKEKQISEMRAVMVTKFAEFYAILTPGQRSTLAEKLEKMHKRWRH